MMQRLTPVTCCLSKARPTPNPWGHLPVSLFFRVHYIFIHENFLHLHRCCDPARTHWVVNTGLLLEAFSFVVHSLFIHYDYYLYH